MAESNLIGGLIGGVLIGCAADLLLLINGRIAGISGILGGLVSRSSSWAERSWRLAFIIGLIAGAGLYGAISNGLSVQLQAGPVILLVAGILVGLGTHLGSGCTSGHGVCGLARRSRRSLAATLVFMIVAALTVFLTRHLL
jgi:uncharacterized membrane protein YedE/YeeE